MAVQLEIPDSVAQAIRLPEDRLQNGLLEELAVALYQHGLLSFGKARELTRQDARGFSTLLAERGVTRHYSHEELSDGLASARRS